MSDEKELEFERRTKALNDDISVDPFMQKAAEKCENCRAELKGPCAAQFSDLYKCAMDNGQLLGAPECRSFAKTYVNCVERDYDHFVDKCPMYMALLKVNMDNSPCKKAADKIDKFCGTPNIKCHSLKRQLRECIEMTQDTYKYMEFWKIQSKKTRLPPRKVGHSKPKWKHKVMH
mmetsp:Transcript_94820/g.116125  ORF Transcript_94820/g.116125 Transcript_94820/m.116125 type:complete len:175 (-) Transcript_94820:9-533(-)